VSNNITILDGNGATTVQKTTDNAGVHTPHSNIDTVLPGTGATSLGKAEDAAHASGDVGVMSLAVRSDAGGALAGTDGDYAPLQVNAAGELRVAIGTSISLSGAVDTELTTADLDTGAGTDTRAVVGLVIAESGGGQLVGSAHPLPVTVISGGGGGTQYTEDAASAGGESLTLAGTVRRNSPASSAGTDGDYATLNTDASGQLYVKAADTDAILGATNESAPVADTGTSGLNGRLQRIAQRLSSLISLLPSALVSGRLDVNLGGVASNSLDTNSGNKSAGTVRVVLATDQPALTNPQPVAGSAAVGAAPSGNPLPMAGTDGTNTQRLRTSAAVGTGNVHQPASNTAAVVTKAAGGAGVSNVLGGVYWSYDLDPTGGSLKIEDGSGTTIFFVSITSKGPGFLPFRPALKGTANTALIVTLAAGGSGVTGKVNVNTWTE
jgi:hypothetical protein